MFNDQELLQLAIISFILVRVMRDQFRGEIVKRNLTLVPLRSQRLLIPWHIHKISFVVWTNQSGLCYCCYYQSIHLQKFMAIDFWFLLIIINIKIVFVKVMEILIKAFSNFQGHGCSWTSQGDNSELWQGNVRFELSN